MARAKEKDVVPEVTQGFDIKQLIINQQRVVEHIRQGGTLKNFKVTCSDAKSFKSLPSE